MGWESEQDKQSKKLLQTQQGLYKDIRNDSRFGTLFDKSIAGPQYKVEDYTKAADVYADTARKNLLGQSESMASSAVNQATQSLASQGITGGSFLNAMQNKARAPIYNNALNSLGNIDLARMKQQIGILDNANKMNLAYLQNALAPLQAQYGLQSGALAQQGQAIGMLDDTTPWDDIMAVANLAVDAISAGAKAGWI